VQTVSLDEVVRRLQAIRAVEPSAAPAPPTAGGRLRALQDDPVLKRALELFDGNVVAVEE
jgi:hypothetical protein